MATAEVREYADDVAGQLELLLRKGRKVGAGGGGLGPLLAQLRAALETADALASGSANASAVAASSSLTLAPPAAAGVDGSLILGGTADLALPAGGDPVFGGGTGSLALPLHTATSAGAPAPFSSLHALPSLHGGEVGGFSVLGSGNGGGGLPSFLPPMPHFPLSTPAPPPSANTDWLPALSLPPGLPTNPAASPAAAPVGGHTAVTTGITSSTGGLLGLFAPPAPPPPAPSAKPGESTPSRDAGILGVGGLSQRPGLGLSSSMPMPWQGGVGSSGSTVAAPAPADAAEYGRTMMTMFDEARVQVMPLSDAQAWLTARVGPFQGDWHALFATMQPAVQLVQSNGVTLVTDTRPTRPPAPGNTAPAPASVPPVPHPAPIISRDQSDAALLIALQRMGKKAGDYVDLESLSTCLADHLPAGVPMSAVLTGAPQIVQVSASVWKVVDGGAPGTRPNKPTKPVAAAVAEGGGNARGSSPTTAAIAGRATSGSGAGSLAPTPTPITKLPIAPKPTVEAARVRGDTPGDTPSRSAEEDGEADWRRRFAQAAITILSATAPPGTPIVLDDVSGFLIVPPEKGTLADALRMIPGVTVDRFPPRRKLAARWVPTPDGFLPTWMRTSVDIKAGSMDEEEVMWRKFLLHRLETTRTYHAGRWARVDNLFRFPVVGNRFKTDVAARYLSRVRWLRQEGDRVILEADILPRGGGGSGDGHDAGTTTTTTTTTATAGSGGGSMAPATAASAAAGTTSRMPMAPASFAVAAMHVLSALDFPATWVPLTQVAKYLAPPATSESLETALGRLKGVAVRPGTRKATASVQLEDTGGEWQPTWQRCKLEEAVVSGNNAVDYVWARMLMHVLDERGVTEKGNTIPVEVVASHPAMQSLAIVSGVRVETWLPRLPWLKLTNSPGSPPAITILTSLLHPLTDGW